MKKVTYWGIPCFELDDAQMRELKSVGGTTAWGYNNRVLLCPEENGWKKKVFSNGEDYFRHFSYEKLPNIPRGMYILTTTDNYGNINVAVASEKPL